jgi:hypothetical protein
MEAITLLRVLLPGATLGPHYRKFPHTSAKERREMNHFVICQAILFLMRINYFTRT